MLPFHPFANIFPLIEGPEFEALVADVKAHGLIEKIVIFEDSILDGRNRYRASIAAGLIDRAAPAHDGIGMQEWCRAFLPEHEGDPLEWVFSKNALRRHLNETQRAAAAAKYETLSHGGERSGQDANLQVTRRRAAERFNVSERSVASAKKVLTEGAPELIARVEQGSVAVSVAEKLAALPKDRQSEIVAATPADKLKTAAKQVAREAMEKRLGQSQLSRPTKLYGVILADPPWRFAVRSRETGLDRAADNHYPTQDLAEIKASHPVGTLAARDCVLFLWTTSPMLPQALEAMRYWGFDYVSHTIWRKAESYAGAAGEAPRTARQGRLTLGTGYWFRNGHEVLLVGTRGTVPAPAPGKQWPSVVDAPPLRHSQKPAWAYDLIESYFPSLPRIELNARARRAGWDAWGLEAPEHPPEAGTAAPGEGMPPAAGDGEGAHTPASPSPAPSSSPPSAAVAPPRPVGSPALSLAEQDAVIREVYGRPGLPDFAEIERRTGRDRKSATKRAWQLKLGSRDRQREAVAAANRRRGHASGEVVR